MLTEAKAQAQAKCGPGGERASATAEVTSVVLGFCGVADMLTGAGGLSFDTTFGRSAAGVGASGSSFPGGFPGGFSIPNGAAATSG